MGVDTYAGALEAIRGATAYQLNELATELAHNRAIPDAQRELLQVAFARRCRELSPRRGRVTP